MLGLESLQEVTEQILLIKERMQAARERKIKKEATSMGEEEVSILKLEIGDILTYHPWNEY